MIARKPRLFSTLFKVLGNLRCFLHISEFGFEGYRYLPGLATISDDLVLWAPAALQAEQAKRAGASIVGADEILELVERRAVRIVGREHYLLERSSRKNGWPLAEWTDAYDGEIARIAERDRDLPTEERKVFFADLETGEGWARDELASQGPKLTQVEALIDGAESGKGERGILLPGLVEKLDRLPSREQKLACALRDIRNHTLAAEEVGAELSVEPLAFRKIVADLSNPPREAPATPEPSLDGVRELLEVVMSLAPLKDATDLRSLLAIRELPIVRHQIERLLFFTPQPKERIQGELEAAGEAADWLQTLLNPSTVKGSLLLDLVGVVLARLLEEPNLMFTGPLTRLGCALAEAGEQVARYEEVRQEPIPYGGLTLPFILTFGDETATFDRIGESLRRLEDSHRVGLI